MRRATRWRPPAQAERAIHCPTCRKRTAVHDIALVDAGRTPAAAEGGAPAGALSEEEAVQVRGSYSTKVRLPLRPHPPAQQNTRRVVCQRQLGLRREVG